MEVRWWWLNDNRVLKNWWTNPLNINHSLFTCHPEMPWNTQCYSPFMSFLCSHLSLSKHFQIVIYVTLCITKLDFIYPNGKHIYILWIILPPVINPLYFRKHLICHNIWKDAEVQSDAIKITDPYWQKRETLDAYIFSKCVFVAH